MPKITKTTAPVEASDHTVYRRSLGAGRRGSHLFHQAGTAYNLLHDGKIKGVVARARSEIRRSPVRHGERARLHLLQMQQGETAYASVPIRAVIAQATIQ